MTRGIPTTPMHTRGRGILMTTAMGATTTRL